MIRIETDEDARQYELLMSPSTAHGAALWRYGAAMYFFASGQMPAEALEVFRICSPLDGEDPRKLLAARGLASVIELATPV
jgi:hypothetical protein